MNENKLNLTKHHSNAFRDNLLKGMDPKQFYDVLVTREDFDKQYAQYRKHGFAFTGPQIIKSQAAEMIHALSNPDDLDFRARLYAAKIVNHDIVSIGDKMASLGKSSEESAKAKQELDDARRKYMRMALGELQPDPNLTNDERRYFDALRPILAYAVKRGYITQSGVEDAPNNSAWAQAVMRNEQPSLSISSDGQIIEGKAR